MELNDINKELIKKAADGDMEAFESIYKSASGFVYSVSYRILLNHEDSQENMQEVFIKVFRNLSDFKFESTFKTWVYRVTVNSALNLLSKRNNQSKHTVELNESLEYPQQEEHASMPQDAINSEKTINELLKKLSEEHRTVVVLRDIQGLSYEEIAQTLNIPVNTVRSRLNRAREKLMKLAEIEGALT